MRTWALFPALLFLTSATHGQIPSRAMRVEGFVEDATGSAIPDAKVVLRHRDGQEWGEILTTSAGIFHFVAVPPGEYTIQVEKAGFRASNTEVVIASRPLTSLRIVLLVGELHEEVTVKSESDPWELTVEPADNRSQIVL